LEHHLKWSRRIQDLSALSVSSAKAAKSLGFLILFDHQTVGLGQGLHQENKKKKIIIKNIKHEARSQLGAEVKYCTTYYIFQK
jgi:hypothetical protein